MTSAHYHLIVNHMPIVGLLIGILVLIVGLFLKKTDIKLTALSIFVFSALAAIVAFYTGDGAENIVENLTGVSETLIHNHEEYAETFLTLTLILGAISLAGLIALVKKIQYVEYLMMLILLVALSAGVLAIYVGNSGGEIRHTEIRNHAKMIPLEKEDD